MGNGALGRRRDDAWVPMDETGDYVEEDAVHISPKSVEDCLVHGGSMHNVGVMSHILGRIESHANRDAEHSGLYEAVTEHVSSMKLMQREALHDEFLQKKKRNRMRRVEIPLVNPFLERRLQRDKDEKEKAEAERRAEQQLSLIHISEPTRPY